jgi:hypothetical protein
VSALSEEKLIEMLTEIQSDIRQIKFDLQLLMKRKRGDDDLGTD